MITRFLLISCSYRENSDSSKKPRVQIIEIKSLGDKDVVEDVKVGNKAAETKLPSVLAVSPLQHTGNTHTLSLSLSLSLS